MRYEQLSYWMSSVDDELVALPALGGDLDADVAIVGAGFTGLWTAYYLHRADPTLRIVVLEAQIAGFGASGRNGGWCSALLPTSPEELVHRHGRDAGLALVHAMQSTVDEVGRVTSEVGIACDYAKGGTVILARNNAQRARGLAEVERARSYGLELAWLEADEAVRRCGATGVLGATYTPHCAAIHPARLVRGLARVVRGRGVRLFERTPATAIVPAGSGSRAMVRTPGGTVRADVVVRATEAYTARLPGLRRRVVPLYSLMIATEPLPSSFWAQAGLAGRETFGDFRNLIIYGQRTSDDRFAFGGRGAPYHWGSAIRPGFDQVPRVHAALHAALRELFPAIEDAAITHTWGGPLAAPRDWTASAGFDRRRGIAWGGGYVGDGVSTANLAGRTLAALIRETGDDLTRLPWVNHRSPDWEPEPLRFAAINALTRVMGGADRAEERTGRPARRAALVNRLLGH
ncbi:MAG TPA: FAD-dependent oxidoreductase [Micromonosporaceae bacterium]|jgi:glycine/D-amino acid oxidase-like deaminating enzyme